ncbi:MULTISPECIES: FAD-dependent monooxygenase [Arthrobacter]|uniref:FAD-dependent oxidoreductase n=1 Tax=Arthrobacter terricola TaxID=2547396 RepID=A0A4R5KDN5_9MICC|nr:MULTISPECIES: FAD-dependent monooxygenase [Arthrobacter]MBT8162406.1 FAD-dependent monooxygenase [Arthrobacter sp. GN70]TDF93343.1 FAD-dependent oxidoreductase [Arthrobacter terricola]
MRVLISGASIAGPTAAYWLCRAGHSVTVIERASGPRTTGGHAVDLFTPALNILDRMGVLSEVLARDTGTTSGIFFAPGLKRPLKADIERFIHAISEHHVEIMRDDLSAILTAATGNDVEYLFGDTITALSPDTGEVSFDHAPPRTFDAIIGADGLHSNVRRLVFGAEEQFSSFLGANLAVFSLPKVLGLDRRILAYLDVGRLAATYSARHLSDARALFLFRTESPAAYDRHDVPAQKNLLRAAFTGLDSQVDRWLEELQNTEAFYFDAITQLSLDTWSRGRVTLVGDAGYCPGAVVGGSTSLAIVGAYVLAGELTQASNDYIRAFAAAEREMLAYVQGSRSLARHTARILVPANQAQVWALVHGTRLISRLPAPLARAAARFSNQGLRLADSMKLKDYS